MNSGKRTLQKQREITSKANMQNEFSPAFLNPLYFIVIIRLSVSSVPVSS